MEREAQVNDVAQANVLLTSLHRQQQTTTDEQQQTTLHGDKQREQVLLKIAVHDFAIKIL